MEFIHKNSWRLLGTGCLLLLVGISLVYRAVRDRALDDRSTADQASQGLNESSPRPAASVPEFVEASRRTPSLLKEGDFVTVTEPNLAFARSDFATAVAFEVSAETPLPRNGETLAVGTAGIVESFAGRNPTSLVSIGIQSGPLRGMTLRIPPDFLKLF